MRYKTREGIVLTRVCGQFVLVAAKKARGNCPYITKINETTASCWRMLEEGCTQDDLIERLQESYEIEDISLVKKDVHSLLEQFLELGYIISTDEEDQNEENE